MGSDVNGHIPDEILDSADCEEVAFIEPVVLQKIDAGDDEPFHVRSPWVTGRLDGEIVGVVFAAWARGREVLNGWAACTEAETAVGFEGRRIRRRRSCRDGACLVGCRLHFHEGIESLGARNEAGAVVHETRGSAHHAGHHVLLPDDGGFSKGTVLGAGKACGGHCGEEVEDWWAKKKERKERKEMQADEEDGW